ncbi:hypothetical protein NLJ89_g8956 [Agrocybe chaxingu]|uniref:Cytochrome P450 n=1 Tax=Agrocybe chaxingu TaxID=84603 RepID=A0A9W8JWN3_9AGAR|nr:hypothetical protein NLJ89_g8956 [Agrocybe chaxingu]
MSVAAVLALVLSLLLACIVYFVFIAPSFNPLLAIAGPPTDRGLFTNYLQPVLDPTHSPRTHEAYVKKYGRSIRIRGVGPWDTRLLTLDPASVSHVLKNSTLYEKPWQSRTLITSLIGCGMLAAEGQVHKRQRRVATPAFSIQNHRALVPLVFRKGTQLKDRWMQMAKEQPEERVTLDVCHWVSRATFDVIGMAGFDYNFNAIRDESNELFMAYKEMFETAISQGSFLRTMLRIYLPSVSSLFVRYPPFPKISTSQVIKSNIATDLPPDQRISDADILHNINTFMFAGSDTSSLSLTWTLLLLAQNPAIQDRLRAELLSTSPISSGSPADLTEDEIQSLFTTISNLPYLHNVIRESIRLIPPVHSTIRVATQDDEVPTSYPVHRSDGTIIDRPTTVSVPKGSFVHVAVEGFQLDKEFWGEDAWQFQPDRWDRLPEVAAELPGLFSNTLAFSAGPRSCIGMRFSMIEIKTFIYILLTNFLFFPTGDRIMKANVVLTRPYVAGKFKQGSQCPLIVVPYNAKQSASMAN